MSDFKSIKYENDNISIDIRYDEENKSVWLTKSEIAKVFEKDRSVISKNITEIKSKVGQGYANMHTLETRYTIVNNQKTEIYNLKTIEEICSKTHSQSGIYFIKWANSLISNNKHNELVEISLDEGIKSKIYVIRGMQVMLDFELAEIYGYDTKAFNQQVQRNIEKFPYDFMFQLTKTELGELSWSQNVTLNKGRGYNFKYLPYAFTEQGIYMLMTVLKGDLATKQSILIIRTFKAMKDYIFETMNSLLIYPFKT